MASLGKEAEVALARELAAGNLSAFDDFVESFRTRLFQYSLLVCGHREDAEEVAQDTLLKVFENFDQLREPEHVRAWVFRIARNACLMKRRKSVFAPTQELSLDELMPARGQAGGERKLEIADWSSLPETAVLRAELKAVLEDAIGGLPEIYKTVLLLRDVENSLHRRDGQHPGGQRGRGQDQAPPGAAGGAPEPGRLPARERELKERTDEPRFHPRH